MDACSVDDSDDSPSPEPSAQSAITLNPLPILHALLLSSVDPCSRTLQLRLDLHRRREKLLREDTMETQTG